MRRNIALLAAALLMLLSVSGCAVATAANIVTPETTIVRNTAAHIVAADSPRTLAGKSVANKVVAETVAVTGEGEEAPIAPADPANALVMLDLLLHPPEIPPEPEAPKPGRWLDPNKPMIALTFDDGPGKITLEILETLRQNNVVGTFCVIGYLAENNPKTLIKTVEQGSQVIGHSWDHTKLTKLDEDAIREQLTRTNAVIAEITGITPTMFRPPYGSVNDRVKAVSAEEGFAIINWNVDTIDWKTRDADAVYEEVMASARNGAIVLFHDIYSTTAEAVARVVPELIEQGYQLVTVEELLTYGSRELTAGKVYNSRGK